MDNRTDTWPTHSDVRVGSGREVEAASNVFVPPGGETFAGCGCSTIHDHEHHHEHHGLHTSPPSRMDEIKTRGAALASEVKSRSIETMDTLKRELSSRSEILKREMATRSETLKREMSARTAQAKLSMARAQVNARNNMTTQVNRMNYSMKTEPMKWAGIAAGSGVVLGLIGRYVHWRATRPVPQVIVIEAC